MIRPLGPEDVAAFVRLRAEYLRSAPLAFASSPESDQATPDALHRIIANAPDSVILGAFDPHLVGAVSVYRDPQPKSRHKVHLWGMYVAPSSRERGLGTALLDAAVGHARTLGVDWVHLSVTSVSTGARRLYERAGFRQWGIESDALRWGGQSVDEVYMALRLE